jgi:hypothetical protein
MTIRNFCRAAAILALCLAPPARAAAPEEPVAAPPSVQGIASAASGSVYELEREMVVHNWVLCVSGEIAEELVRAREESADRALAAYAGFRQARTCGQIPELRVILQERLYVSTAESGHDARAFGALVNLAGEWASAFVVYGGLPEQ